MTPTALPITVPDGQSGDWKVETFSVSKDESAFSRIRATMHPGEYVAAGTYKRLVRGRTVVMSNTQMEINTNIGFIQAAKGNVLINGLGLGMVLIAILKKSGVTKVRVIEKSGDVIKLVAPSFAEDKRVEIIHDDAFEYQPPKGERFDAVWHDIWDCICSDNLEQMRKLERKYARRTDWQGSWSKIECLRARHRYGY